MLSFVKAFYGVGKGMTAKKTEKGKEGMMANIGKAVLSWLAKEILVKVTEKAPDLLSKMKAWWQGKTIAIIGPTASGKNSLFDRVRNQPAPNQHIQTRGAEEVGNFNFTWAKGEGGIDFKCKRSLNVGGEVDERERFWGQACAGSDVIFYLVDLQKLNEDRESILNRIKSDLKWLATNLKNFKKDVKIHILLNKVDTLPFSGEPEDQREHIMNVLKDESAHVREIAIKFFADQKNVITGISPISMVDDYLFRTFFTNALSSVFAGAEKV